MLYTVVAPKVQHPCYDFWVVKLLIVSMLISSFSRPNAFGFQFLPTDFRLDFEPIRLHALKGLRQLKISREFSCFKKNSPMLPDNK